MAHAAALARRVTRTRQIELLSEQTLRQRLASQETELRRQHAEEQARLLEQLERLTAALAQANKRPAHAAAPASPDWRETLDAIKSSCQQLQQQYQDTLDRAGYNALSTIIANVNGLLTDKDSPP